MVPRTKGDKARVIELDAQTGAALTGWKAIQDKERQLVGAGYEDNGLVFCQPDGRPYHPEAFSKAFDRRLGEQRFRGPAANWSPRPEAHVGHSGTGCWGRHQDGVRETRSLEHPDHVSDLSAREERDASGRGSEGGRSDFRPSDRTVSY